MRSKLFGFLFSILFCTYSIGQKNLILISGGGSLPWGNLTENPDTRDYIQLEPGPIVGISYSHEFWKGGGAILTISGNQYKVDQQNLKDISNNNPSFTILGPADQTWKSSAILFGIFQQKEIGKKQKMAIGISAQFGLYFSQQLGISYLKDLNNNSQQIVSYSENSSTSLAADIAACYTFRFNESISGKVLFGYRIGGATNNYETLDLPLGIKGYYSEDILIHAINVQLGMGYSF